MDSPSTFNVDGRVVHVGRDQLNLTIQIQPSPPVEGTKAIPSVLLSALSGVVSYSSKMINGLYFYLFSTPDSLVNDLSQKVTLQGAHYIARGEFADVWEGIMADKKVAAKVLRGGSSSNPDFLQKFKERLELKAQIWQYLKHPNVSEFYGLAFNFGYMPALILPFYGNGTVVDYVKEKENETKMDLVGQIAQGLDYLHGQSVVHGDLRGSNVLIDGDGYPRICDYGLAFIIEPSEFTSIKTAGACRWTAPEIMNPPEDVVSMDESLALFTNESDVYAFAMTVIEIFTGKIPFSQKKNDSSVIFAVLTDSRPDLPPFLDDIGLGELVQQCWDKEPCRRPTAREVARRLNVARRSSISSPRANTALGVVDPWFGSWFSWSGDG